MPELLLEFFCEEIPARMQQRATFDLERMMNERLLAAGFMPEGVKAFAGPRRLTLVATGLPARQPDRREEKKGPRVGAPQAAIDGFLKSAGVSSLEACEVRDDKKGQFYVAIVDQKGRDTAAVIAEAAPDIARNFPWPKAMRWGEGQFRWVRPLKRVLCCFNDEVVAFDIDGLAADDATEGHRIHAPGLIRARNWEKYAAALAAAHVVIDGAERAEEIEADAKTLCEAQGLDLVADPGLLAEVAGLAEWPVVMMGAFDAKFLALPDEVLTAVMRGHQKYFSVRDPRTGRLANRFVFVANLEAPDGGRAMRTGYERVLTARLSDAWYLYRKDLERPLEDRVADLDRVTFFEGLGSVGDKARRIELTANMIANELNFDERGALAERAAKLSKADLVTGMVFEFPELQGIIGRYYAIAQGEPRTVADAIQVHYQPLGVDDRCPDFPEGIAVALADKLDSLMAFWMIGKKPTGSGDPFALRRAALGVIRILVDNKLNAELVGSGWMTPFVEIVRLRRSELLSGIRDTARKQQELFEMKAKEESARNAHDSPLGLDSARIFWLNKMADRYEHFTSEDAAYAYLDEAFWPIAHDLTNFMQERFYFFMKERGYKHDRVRAALIAKDDYEALNFYKMFMRVEALDAFLKSDDGANLAAGFKRAANILKAEEKKGGAGERVEPSLLQEPQEKALFAALEITETNVGAAVAAERFGEAMAALAALRPVVDAFFEKVTVNADDAALRANRLALLRRFIAATTGVADLSKLEG